DVNERLAIVWRGMAELMDSVNTSAVARTSDPQLVVRAAGARAVLESSFSFVESESVYLF
ncbi:hypothetical protein FRX31_008804, partial [Thalictrum thalictroides]